MMERYGDFFSGSDFDLDQTLTELSTEPSAADSSGQISARSRGRKSAGPAMLSQATLASGAAKEASAAAAGKITSLSRRRRTIAPGQVCQLHETHADTASTGGRSFTAASNIVGDLNAYDLVLKHS